MMPIRDLHLDGEGPVYQQIYRAIRDDILSGRAAPGVRLPASRALARDLAVSRTTVLGAYEQLLAEGYLVGRTGSGTFVAPQLPAQAPSKPRSEPRRPASEPARLSRFGERLVAQRPRRPYKLLADRGEVRFDFIHSVPDVNDLPLDAWQRIAARRAASTPPDRLLYGEPAGLPELRGAIARYLARARGVAADPDQVMIVSGVGQALNLAARLLLDEGDGALIEEPHYVGARRAFRAAGAELVPAPVDEEGLDVLRLPDTRARPCKLGYVTPSHQFPTGAVLSLARRLALLDWADRTGAYLVEDDYDSEFRYSGSAIPSLKSLDEGDRVLYVGTFSKTLFPALRIGYAVVPRPLAVPFQDAKWLSDWSNALPGQEALAEFVESGEYERHLRRARTLYGRRRAAFLAGLQSRLGDRVEWRDSHAGLHVLVRIPWLPAEQASVLIERALEREVGLYPAGPHYLERPDHSELVLGFSRIDEDRIDEGLARFAALLDELARPSGTG